MIEGFFWVRYFPFREIWQVYFWGLDLSRNFSGYSKQTEDSWLCRCHDPAANTNIQSLLYFWYFFIYCFLENFKDFIRLENSAWDFFEVNFWSSRDVFGFWFLLPFDHPCNLKSGVPPWACYTVSRFFVGTLFITAILICRGEIAKYDRHQTQIVKFLKSRNKEIKSWQNNCCPAIPISRLLLRICCM